MREGAILFLFDIERSIIKFMILKLKLLYLKIYPLFQSARTSSRKVL